MINSQAISQNVVHDHSVKYVETASGRSAGTIASHNNASDFSFFDLIDMINPLQHIPVVNHAYRKMTGDTIKPISSLIGGAAYGGPLGAANGLVNMIVAQETGQDIVGHVFNAPSATMSYQSHNKMLNNDLSVTLLQFTDNTPRQYNE